MLPLRCWLLPAISSVPCLEVASLGLCQFSLSRGRVIRSLLVSLVSRQGHRLSVSVPHLETASSSLCFCFRFNSSQPLHSPESRFLLCENTSAETPFYLKPHLNLIAYAETLGTKKQGFCWELERNPQDAGREYDAGRDMNNWQPGWEWKLHGEICRRKNSQSRNLPYQEQEIISNSYQSKCE